MASSREGTMAPGLSGNGGSSTASSRNASRASGLAASAFAPGSLGDEAPGRGAVPFVAEDPPDADALPPTGRAGSSEMILRMDARISSMLGSGAFSGLVIVVASPERGWPQATANLRPTPPSPTARRRQSRAKDYGAQNGGDLEAPAMQAIPPPALSARGDYDRSNRTAVTSPACAGRASSTGPGARDGHRRT
jgi:hypothetical protein